MRLTRREFICAVVLQQLATPEEAPKLFEMLCHGEPGRDLGGFGGFSRFSARKFVVLDGIQSISMVLSMVSSETQHFA